MSTPANPRPRRSRRLLVILAVLAVLAVLLVTVGPRVYSALVSDDTPTLSAPTSSGAALTTVPDGTYAAGTGSVGGYRIKEVLNGVDTTVVGRTSDISAELVLGSGVIESGSVTLVMASVETNSGARDGDFRNRFLQTDEFPNATFTITEPVTLPDAPSAEVMVTGDLTLHGVTKSVVVTTTATTDPTDPSAITVTGSLPVALSDYQIERPDLGFVSVEPSGSIEFELHLTPTP